MAVLGALPLQTRCYGCEEESALHLPVTANQYVVGKGQQELELERYSFRPDYLMSCRRQTHGQLNIRGFPYLDMCPLTKHPLLQLGFLIMLDDPSHGLQGHSLELLVVHECGEVLEHFPESAGKPRHHLCVFRLYHGEE